MSSALATSRQGLPILALAGVLATVAPALAQENASSGSEAVAVVGGLDFASQYVFRGVRQNATGVVASPFVDVSAKVLSGDGPIKRVDVSAGFWNSLHSGDTGSGGPMGKPWYEARFSGALEFRLGGGVTVTPTYTAYTSPNGLFGTVQELAFKTAITHKIAPYVVLAQELGAVGADGGANKGTYVELGIGPSWPVAGGKATIGIPVKVGLSANNYYELNGVDNKFGFLDVGALLTVPLTAIPAHYGAWNVHFGGDAFLFGETTKAINAGKRSKGVFLFGFGVGY